MEFLNAFVALSPAKFDIFHDGMISVSLWILIVPFTTVFTIIPFNLVKGIRIVTICFEQLKRVMRFYYKTFQDAVL